MEILIILASFKTVLTHPGRHMVTMDDGILIQNTGKTWYCGSDSIMISLKLATTAA